MINQENKLEKYYLFSDESSHTSGRYRSISSLSIKADIAKNYHEELKKIIAKNNIKEFKWNKFNGDGKYTKAATELLNWLLDKQNQNLLRVDTIIWDTQDYRHSIQDRDDKCNFARMYYHLLNNVVNKYPVTCYFEFYPDEMCGFDWQTLENCISAKNHVPNDGAFIKNGQGLKINFDKIKSKIEATTPLKSEDYVYIQLTDFFAGLAVFSYNNYNNYRQWQMQQSGQISLFGNSNTQDYSKSEKVRYKLLNDFMYHKAKSQSIRINNQRGLKTFNPSENINFWFYIPQHSKDKAPQKEKALL